MPGLTSASELHLSWASMTEADTLDPRAASALRRHLVEDTMQTTRQRIATAAALTLGTLTPCLMAAGQEAARPKGAPRADRDPVAAAAEPRHEFGTRQALNTFYEDQFLQLDRRRIAD